MTDVPKHLRPRWRYLVIALETWPGASVDREPFQRAVWYSAQGLLGDAGSADLDLTVVRFRFDGASGEAIVRTFRGSVDPARAVLACIDSVSDQPVGLWVTGVSGTIRACEEKYMGHQLEGPEERTVEFDGADRSGTVRGERVDVSVGDVSVGATTMDLH